VGPLTVELRGGADLDHARTFLLEAGREELVAVLGRVAQTEYGLVFLAQEIDHAPEEMVWRDEDGLHWKPELTRRWTHRIEISGQGIVLLHGHSNRGKVRLSPTDTRTCGQMLEHFELAVPVQAHGYGVVGPDAIAGVFAWRDDRIPWTRLKTVACPIKIWFEAPPASLPPAPTMARQVAAISVEGQARMSAATIALVGVGGAGSMVADELAHMGAGTVLICEADIVKDVNLSRQEGAGPSNIGALKADVTAASMRHANPDVRIVVIPERFPGQRSFQILRDSDVIVSCVDGPTARHEINKFARRFLIPLIDVGATIRRDETGHQLQLITGHTARVLPDGACLECEGLTSPALREKERNGREVPYWEGEDAPGAPQIMSVNGVLASLAVTEVLRVVAGLREDWQTRHWRYEALEGELYAREPVAKGCDVCQTFGRGDE